LSLNLSSTKPDVSSDTSTVLFYPVTTKPATIGLRI